MEKNDYFYGSSEITPTSLMTNLGYFLTPPNVHFMFHIVIMPVYAYSFESRILNYVSISQMGIICIT